MALTLIITSVNSLASLFAIIYIQIRKGGLDKLNSCVQPLTNFLAHLREVSLISTYLKKVTYRFFLRILYKVKLYST